MLIRDTVESEDERAGTEEQRETITRIRDCRENDYYTILGIWKSCSEKKLREAYKNLSLLTLPDSNKFPGSEEAFVSELIHLSSLTVSIAD